MPEHLEVVVSRAQTEDRIGPLPEDRVGLVQIVV